MVIVVLPGYNCQKTLEKVVNAIPMEYVDDIIYVDDCSTDNSFEIARGLGIRHIIRHDYNIGYGGNQKTLYMHALGLGADVVIMLHPDYQYDPKLIPDILFELNGDADVVLASRFVHGREAYKFGMPLYKYFSNRILTIIQNFCFNQKLTEYHTGYRAYKSNVLQKINFTSFSNDFIFDNQMILEIIKHKFKIAEIYCPAKYERESSSITFFRSVKYGILVLWYSIVYKLNK